MRVDRSVTLKAVVEQLLQCLRTAIELSVLLIGTLLAGYKVLGIGTLLFAFGIGPLTQLMLPWVLVRLEAQD